MRSRREAVFLIVLFIALLPAVTARLYSSDEVQYFSYLRSLWFDHDVSFENEYRYFYDHHIAQSADFHRTFLELETATGRRINYGTIGCAILWSPFYAIADLSARGLRATGRDIAVDGYSRPYVAAVAYGSAFYGFATIVLAVRAARRVAGARALSSGLAVWAGTPLLFYMYIAPPFSHACSAFAVALFVTIWLHVRQTWSAPGVVALGLAGALMAMVREQDIFFAFGPALDLALTLYQETGRRSQDARRNVTDNPRGWPRLVKSAVFGISAFALGYLPQLVAYNSLNGHPSPSPLVARKMFWTAPHAAQVLVDTHHGFLFWTPLAALSLTGLVLMTVAPRGRLTGNALTVRAESGVGSTDDGQGEIRRLGACMLVMVGLQVYISGVVESWTVAGAFGQRRFVAITIFLVIGLAALREWLRGTPARLAVNVAIVICIWWNVALMAEFGTSMMDRQRLELGRNAYDAFVTLPRMAPGLLHRYFTERSSFYRPPEPPPR
jgi:uncharacterized membrane protein YuzA (DUF378 family)